MALPDLSKFYINGAWVAPATATSREVINPATGAPFASVAMGSSADVDAAVAAARAALPAFAAWSKTARVALLERILAIYTERVDEFADAIRLEMGAPIRFARDSQAQVGIDHLAAMIEDLKAFEFEETLPNGDLQFYEPVGVCGLITPWNWPINQMVLKIGPALSAGCTMVLKPSELTPVSATLLARVLDAAGVPPGVFNLVHGDGPTVGSALSKHPEVAMMSFTGSTRAGKSILADSVEKVSKVTLELGGKSPNLIFADCDLEEAVRGGLDACFINSGQSCDAATRMLVERSVYDRAVALAGELAAKIEVGDPAEDGDHLGPMVSETQYRRVQDMIEVGLAEGARLICGGPGHPEGFETGYFARPTVFADVRPDMRIAREEIFGPVLVMIPFEDEADGISIANDSEYGLGAYVQCADTGRALRVARALQSGTVNINGAYLSSGSPFGGVKTSGLGREGGADGIRDFLESKVVSMP